MNKRTIEIEMNKANAGTVAAVAEVLGKTPEEVVSFCLKGSTNPAMRNYKHK